jgi:hypothetical protein
MVTVNSLSGGKTSSYMTAHFPADVNVFSLVRIEDKRNLWMKGKDELTRKIISDKIGAEFIGTAEMDEIVYTILDLEQYIGSEIKWITGPTFECIIREASNYLPNQTKRFCTVKMKIEPIFQFIKNNYTLPVEMRIGYRYEANDIRRSENMLENANADGLEYYRTVIGKSKSGNRNKWGGIPYRFVKFPLIQNAVTKDVIYNFWKDKPVRFAYRNNCVGCVNRQPLMISHMASKDRDKIEWFERQEILTGNRFLSDVSFSEILKFNQQGVLFEDDDFSDCDSGYCGI